MLSHRIYSKTLVHKSKTKTINTLTLKCFTDFLYRGIKLICNRVIHGFESVCLLRLICRLCRLVEILPVFIGASSSSNNIRFRTRG
jgi:hypothetical protein